MTAFRSSLAVVIGIDGYANGIPPLGSAVADARRLAKILREDHGYDTISLLDTGATLAALRGVLTDVLPRRVGPDDRVLFYFAGHGLALDGGDGRPTGYLVPQDAVRDDPTTFLPMDDLQRALDALPCRHLLAVLDCCFAGTLRWAGGRGLLPPATGLDKDRYARYLRGKAWQAIASASHRQQALDVLAGVAVGNRDGGGRHSPFALALFDALEGKADLFPPATDGKPAGDGVVTTAELFVYLSETVAAGADAVFHRQTPVTWPLKKHDDGEFIFLSPGRELSLPDAPALTREANPYRGLEPYDLAHADLFAGRSAATADLAGKVAVAPLTVVTGASGTGKSSLVRAGMVPALACQGWTALPPLRPGKAPLAELARWADAAALPPGPDRLANGCRAWAEAHTDARLLVVIDQFEELVTQCLDEKERTAFQQAVARLAGGADDRVRVVITVRADFEGQFRDGPLARWWDAGRFPVPPLTQDDYREIITAPAFARTVFFESPGLVEDLVNEVVQMPGGLPLLSFTLSEMYLHYLSRSGDDRCLTRAHYEAVGGVVASLRKRMESLYVAELGGGKDPENEPGSETADQRTLRRVMLRMVAVEGGALARRRVPRDELVYPADEENGRVGRVLEELTAARLVVSDRDADGRPVVEPAHDALVNGWDRLLRWTREEAEQLALRRLLTPAATDWKAGHGGLWWANPRLPVLVRLAGKDGGWLNRDEAAFVRKSEAKRQRTRRWVAGLTGAAFLVLSTLTVVALDQREQARTNEKTAQTNEKIAKEQTERAEDALARGLIRPVGVTAPVVSGVERAALDELAALRPDQDRVLRQFVEYALADPGTAANFYRAGTYPTHIAAQLDLDRRRTILSAARLTERLSNKKLPLPVRKACVAIGVELSAHLDYPEFPALATATVIEAVQTADRDDLVRLRGYLAWTADKFDPDEITRVLLATVESSAAISDNEEPAEDQLDVLLAFAESLPVGLSRQEFERATGWLVPKTDARRTIRSFPRRAWTLAVLAERAWRANPVATQDVLARLVGALTIADDGQTDLRAASSADWCRPRLLLDSAPFMRKEDAGRLLDHFLTGMAETDALDYGADFGAPVPNQPSSKYILRMTKVLRSLASSVKDGDAKACREKVRKALGGPSGFKVAMAMQIRSGLPTEPRDVGEVEFVVGAVLKLDQIDLFDLLPAWRAFIAGLTAEQRAAVLKQLTAGRATVLKQPAAETDSQWDYFFFRSVEWITKLEGPVDLSLLAELRQEMFKPDAPEESLVRKVFAKGAAADPAGTAEDLARAIVTAAGRENANLEIGIDEMARSSNGRSYLIGALKRQLASTPPKPLNQRATERRRWSREYLVFQTAHDLKAGIEELGLSPREVMDYFKAMTTPRDQPQYLRLPPGLDREMVEMVACALKVLSKSLAASVLHELLGTHERGAGCLLAAVPFADIVRSETRAEIKSAALSAVIDFNTPSNRDLAHAAFRDLKRRGMLLDADLAEIHRSVNGWADKAKENYQLLGYVFREARALGVTLDSAESAPIVARILNSIAAKTTSEGIRSLASILAELPGEVPADAVWQVLRHPMCDGESRRLLLARLTSDPRQQEDIWRYILDRENAKRAAQ